MPPRTRSKGGQPGARAGVGTPITFDPRKRPTAPPLPIGKSGVHLRASAGHQCGLSTEDTKRELTLRCQRSKKHTGCHLDVENDTWFDQYEGEWRIMPRSGDQPTEKGGRRSTTRKGV